MIETTRRGLGWLLAAAVCALPAAAQDTASGVDAPPAEVVGDAADGQQPADAAQDPADTTPTPALTVRDLVVLQADHYGTAYNDPSDFASTLFNRSPRRREISPNPNPTPMPLGIITLDGPTPEPLAIRIEVAPDGGRFLGHWPRAVAGEDALVWHGIRAVDTPAGRTRVPDEHWLTPLRDEPGLQPFDTRGHVDRFFAYDATFPFTPTLTVQGNAEDGYTVAGDTLNTHRLVMVVRRSGEGWQVGLLDGASGATAALTMRQAAGPDEALAPVLAVLAEHGYPAAQADTAAAMLRESAFGDASMSLIYLIDRDTLDVVLPLTVAAEGVAVRRLGIVVVNNVEPDIAGTVGGLIEQLGSEDWPTRDAAQRALIEMDRAAIQMVRQNADHPDPEVAFRIEQVIDAFERRHDD